ncbi:MAG: type II secretion system F family protein [Pirellulales bacterium]
MAWDTIIIQAFAFAAVFSLVWFVALQLRPDTQAVDDRLSELAKTGSVKADFGPPAAGSRWAHVSTRLLPDSQAERSALQTRLNQAGIYSPLGLTVYLVVKLALMITPMLVAVSLAAAGVASLNLCTSLGALAGAVGMVLPAVWLDRRRERWRNTLRRSLPDYLDLITACVESGLSFEGAMQKATDELHTAHPALARELVLVQREIELGAPPEKALRGFAERTGLEGLRSLATVVHQSRRYGTGIAEALRVHSDMLRMQREQRAEELAQKAAVKILFPTLVCIFPAIFIVLAGPAAIQIQERFADMQVSSDVEAKR